MTEKQTKLTLNLDALALKPGSGAASKPEWLIKHRAQGLAIGGALAAINKDFEKRVSGLLIELPKLAVGISAFANTLGTTNLKFPTIDWQAKEERDERCLRFAARNNWFIQPETSASFMKDIEACGDQTEALDNIFVESTLDLIPEIKDRLLADYPHRAAVLNEGFSLHQEERYYSSIPLLLLSTEGIALDACNESPFNTDKNRPKVAGWLDKQNLTGLARAYVSSLSVKHPMSQSPKGRLSRHQVLHGRDTSYGTLLFSLQAISLLGFVGWIFAPDGLLDRRSEQGMDTSESA